MTSPFSSMAKIAAAEAVGRQLGLLPESRRRPARDRSRETSNNISFLDEAEKGIGFGFILLLFVTVCILARKPDLLI